MIGREGDLRQEGVGQPVSLRREKMRLFLVEKGNSKRRTSRSNERKEVGEDEEETAGKEKGNCSDGTKAFGSDLGRDEKRSQRGKSKSERRICRQIWEARGAVREKSQRIGEAL